MKNWYTWLIALGAGLALVGCQNSQVIPEASKTVNQPVPVATSSVDDDADMKAEVAEIEAEVDAVKADVVTEAQDMVTEANEEIAEMEAEVEAIESDVEADVEEETTGAEGMIDKASAAVAGATASVGAALFGDDEEDEASMLENAIAIDSSAIDAVSYNADEQVLSIAFPNGEIYDYPNFSPEVFEEFMNADSKGGFFVNRIKDQFEAVQR